MASTSVSSFYSKTLQGEERVMVDVFYIDPPHRGEKISREKKNGRKEKRICHVNSPTSLKSDMEEKKDPVVLKTLYPYPASLAGGGGI